MPPEKYEGRTLTVYLDSKQELNDLIEAAGKAGLPLSHFARELIRKGLEANEAKPDTNLIHEASQSREEVSQLRRELKEKQALIQKMETELFALKQSGFYAPLLDGDLPPDSALIDLLQDGHVRRSDEIMKALGIDTKNIDAIKALAGQLHALQDLRLVVEGPKGWKWVG
jgi:hypothetical protein